MFDPAEVPQLHGLFEATIDEHTDLVLTLQSGALPTDLHGSYLRNGPNPRFTPIGSFTYPLDGDGMVHGVSFDGDRVIYRNRFVRTPMLDAEERAGRALWGGIMSMLTPDAEAVGPQLAGQFKDLPDINVVCQGGRLLALAEGGQPYRLAATLETLGREDFGGSLSFGITAHRRWIR